MIRLAVRCRPEQAEVVLAELVQLAPGGVEEEAGTGLGRVRDLRRRGRAARSRRGRGGSGRRSRRDHLRAHPRRLGRPLARLPRADRAGGRPRGDPPRRGTSRPSPEALDVVIDPGQAFGTGAHPTTRMCVEMLVGLADQGDARAAPSSISAPALPCSRSSRRSSAGRRSWASTTRSPRHRGGGARTPALNGVEIDVRAR